jgi:predicted Zn-dependent peptidase
MQKVSRSVPPAPLPPISFEIPAPFKTQLSNGIRVVVFEDDRVPIVSFRLAFFSGDINDPSDSIGLTSSVVSMLNEGTENYSSLELANKIERLGANISASSGDDFTILSASSLSLYQSEVLSLMAEMALRPTFPEDELDLYRRNTVENLKFQRSQPPFLANEQTARLIYGQHPYSITAPRPSDIESLDRTKLERFHRSTFVPNNAIFIAVGDVGRDEIVRELEDNLGDWQMADVKETEFLKPPARNERTLAIVDRPGSAQSNIVLSNLAIKRTDGDYFPALVMNQVLGAGASSRIFMNLREEKGYTYGAYTRLNTKALAGDIEATAEVRNEVTGDSLKEFFYELERIRDERVSSDELDDAKNFLTGVFPIRAETQEGLTNLLVNQFLYGLPDDYLDTYRDRVAAVSKEDVLSAAQRLVRPAEMAIVIVGDADAVLPQAEVYSNSVEVFDTEGNPKS